MVWMMGNEFYDVVTMKIQFNWKSNWTLSFMETKRLKNQQENQQTIKLAYTQIVFK